MNRDGFTLLELVIALALFAIMGLAAFHLAMASVRLYRVEAAPNRLNAEVRRVLDAIARDLAASAPDRIAPAFPVRSPALDLRRAAGFDAATGRTTYAPAAIRYAVEVDRLGAAIVRYGDAGDAATRRVLTRLVPRDLPAADALAFTLDPAGANVVVDVTLRMRDARGRWVAATRSAVVQLRNRG